MFNSDNPDSAASCRSVRIQTGCRLHFGLLAVKEATGRQFGGAGVMLESPGWDLRLSSLPGVISAQPRDEIIAPPETAHALQATLQKIRTGTPHGVQRGVRIAVTQAIPRHAGLGSGTQLALALARGLESLAGQTLSSAVELARRTERGARSAVGTHGFDRGGCLIEAGKLGDEVSPLVSRLEFPAEWRFLLIRPRDPTSISGTLELQKFAALPPMPSATTARLWNLIETELAPAVASAEYDRASRSLQTYGQLVGEYFAPVQGGVYAVPRMAAIAELLCDWRVWGVGQTSWGPTLFALCASPAQGADLVARLKEEPVAASCHLDIAAPRNRGAEVEVQ